MPAATYCYEYPRPSVTVDMVVFAIRKGRLSVLLIQRRQEPFAGRWAIPGGFLEIDEPAATGALRELREETGVVLDPPCEPIGFFADPGRDPRGRTISLAHVGACPPPVPEPRGGDDARRAAWFPIDELDASSLAFDHDRILASARDWLRSAVRPERYWGLALLPERFSSRDVRELLRLVTGQERGAAAWITAQRERNWASVLPGRPIRYQRASTPPAASGPASFG